MTTYTALQRDIQWMQRVTGIIEPCVPYSEEYRDLSDDLSDMLHFLHRLFAYDTEEEQETAAWYVEHGEHRDQVLHFHNIIGDNLNDVHMKAMDHSMSDLPIYEVMAACGDVEDLLIPIDEAASDPVPADQTFVEEMFLYSLYKGDQLLPTLQQMMHNLSQIPTVFSPYLCDIVYTGYGPEHELQWSVRAATAVYTLRSALHAFERFDYRRDTPIAWQRDVFLTEFRDALTDRSRFEQSMSPALQHVRKDRV